MYPKYIHFPKRRSSNDYQERYICTKYIYSIQNHTGNVQVSLGY